MPSEHDNAESAYERKRVCRYLINLGFNLFWPPLAAIASELTLEAEEGEVNVHSHATRAGNIKNDVKCIIDGKHTLHWVLDGEREDVRLLKAIQSLHEEFVTKICEPLQRLTGGKKGVISNAKGRKTKFRSIARQAGNIAKRCAPHAKTAEKRYFDIIAAESGDRPGPTRVSKGEEKVLSIISIDTKNYSESAIFLQDKTGAEGLGLLNERIQELFRDAAKEAKIAWDTVPRVNTGDGILAFLPDPSKAVQFGFAVQKLALRSNGQKYKADHAQWYRLGIATGMVFWKFTAAADGQVLGFEAAGVAIIDAVRIQSKAAPGAVWIDRETYDKLKNPTWTATKKKETFPEWGNIESKPDEERTIPVAQSRPLK